jgi:formylglycine-generating enzyme required for sulfatase activity
MRWHTCGWNYRGWAVKQQAANVMRKITALPVFILSAMLFPVHLHAQESTQTELYAGFIAEDRHGFEMVYVPAGSFEMGISEKEFRDLYASGGALSRTPHTFDTDSLVESWQPSGIFDTYTAVLPGFWIDRYEVTVEKYQLYFERCIYQQLCSMGASSLEPDSQLPAYNVTWYDATMFCSIRDARLPTEEEWEYAASSPDNFIFPWGNEFIKENFRLDANPYPVDSVPGNVSWSGAYDMVGSVEEWVDGHYTPYHLTDENLREWYKTRNEASRVVRGGASYLGYAAQTTFWRTDYAPDSVAGGFRCARYSDPRNS